MNRDVGSGEQRDPTVMAVVLTFSAPDDLRLCVEALIGQTRVPDKILVVDNAGQPPARETLAGLSPVSVLQMTENTGPAGGFAAGFEAFARTDHDFIWVMDDDVIADSGCLEALLEERSAHVGPMYVRPLVTGPNDEVINWPGWSGVLIGRQAVDAVGFPMSEWVWFFEDTEYLHRRLPQAGFVAVQASSSHVTHGMGRRRDTKPPWKIYYETRNVVYYRLHLQGGRYWYKLVRSLTKMAGRIVIREDDKRVKVALYLRAIRDGVRGAMGITVSLPTASGDSG